MGDFKNNPKKPYEVKVPNKIRKRIFMHERDGAEPKIAVARFLNQTPAKKRGSMWLQFIGTVRRFFGSGK